MSDVCVSDIFSRIGYDFLWIDFEHSYLSYEDILMHTTIAKGNGTPVIVRMPQKDFTATKKVLEMGVDGIIFPMVKTQKEVNELINFSLYPPNGNRGFGPMAAVEYGLADANEYVKAANKEICRFIQIECQEIIESLDEIMKNDYIDGYIFGPNDLSGSVDDFLNVYAEKTTKLMEYAIKKLKECNNEEEFINILNEKEMELADDAVVDDVLQIVNIKVGRKGVWINGRMVRQAEFPERKIHEGDVLIVKRIGAGG